MHRKHSIERRDKQNAGKRGTHHDGNEREKSKSSPAIGNRQRRREPRRNSAMSRRSKTLGMANTKGKREERERERVPKGGCGDGDARPGALTARGRQKVIFGRFNKAPFTPGAKLEWWLNLMLKDSSIQRVELNL